MKGYYISYVCKGCSKEIILITSEVDSSIKLGRYISCSHCSCKNLIRDTETDDLREVMQARRYKRNSRGALEQI